MSEALRAVLPDASADRLTCVAAAMGARLARLLATIDDGGALAAAGGFLDAMARAAGEPERAWAPLDRLSDGLQLRPLEVDLIVLAGLADEHEGYAQILRAVHPAGEPAATVGLAAQLLTAGAGERLALRALLEAGSAIRHGVLELAPGPAFHERSLRLTPRLWSTLHGIPAWPEPYIAGEPAPALAGLDEWLAGLPAVRVARALECGLRATVLVTGETSEAAHDRATALAIKAGVPFARLQVRAPVTRRDELALTAHATAAGVVPVLRVDPPASPSVAAVPAFAALPGPAIVAAPPGAAPATGARPLLAVEVEPLHSGGRQAMWRAALPALADEAPSLARVFRVEPAVAAAVCADASAAAWLDGRAIRTSDITASLRLRSGADPANGVVRIHPRATWDDLVLAPARMRQLREALDRQRLQRTVLDEWGFLADRAGARGVRLLFAGPPGTGKTLSAEVLAGALGVDLLVIDVSRIVSKWLGETERNLSAAFDAAEQAHAVLLFDEADALFGKRTEISDAHDRYANLETAFLLSRLERYEGMAILATNLRRNIDPAFARRLEFIVPYEEPGAAERERLWRVHLPPRAPLADDFDVAVLASRYPVVGGLIRNASVAAAFLAASEGRPIGAAHALRALHREYEKVGRAFPGPPPPEPSVEEVRLGAQDPG